LLSFSDNNHHNPLPPLSVRNGNASSNIVATAEEVVVEEHDSTLAETTTKSENDNNDDGNINMKHRRSGGGCCIGKKTTTNATKRIATKQQQKRTTSGTTTVVASVAINDSIPQPLPTPSTTITTGSMDKLRSFGYKVTVVDWARQVFMIDLVSPSTCRRIRRMTEKHVRNVEVALAANAAADATATAVVRDQGDRRPPVTMPWRGLYSHTKMDLPCVEVPGLARLVSESVTRNIVRVYGDVVGRPRDVGKLHCRSWKEPHLLKCQSVPGKE